MAESTTSDGTQQRSTIPIDSANSIRLRVLTQNVQLTPVIGGTIGQQVLRAGKLVDAILRADPPYDVIGLEEVFMEEPMQVLIDGLKSSYPSILSAIPDGETVFGSGLFFASRFPIRRWKFHRYTKSWGFDALESKGVVISELDVSVNGSRNNLIIALTHQQSGGSYDVMASQLQEGGEALADFLKRADKSMQDYTTIIYMGDMNIDEASQNDLYVQMTSRLGESVLDVFRVLNPTDPGLTWPLTPAPKQRLDYIFAVRRPVNNKCNFDSAANYVNASVDPLVLDGALSDHFGVSTQFDMHLSPNDQLTTATDGVSSAIQFRNEKFLKGSDCRPAN